jgi:hypothetical protein
MAVFLIVLALPQAALAAPNCTVGCPCGNTCIDCSKTCHVGAGGGGDIDGLALGLMLAGAAGGLASLYFILEAEPACRDVPADEVCGIKLGGWLLWAASMTLTIAGVVLQVQSNGVDSRSSRMGLTLTF